MNVPIKATRLNTVPHLSGENEENHDNRITILQTETIICEILNMKQELQPLHHIDNF